MATQRIVVPAGSTSAVLAVTPLTTVIAGPALLGGSVLVEFSPDGRVQWVPWQYGTITQSGVLRLNFNGYVRVTATTQNATVLLVDMGGPVGSTPYIAQFIGPLATASSTAEQCIGALRFPAGFLPVNFTMEIAISLLLSNNANVKTFRARWGLPGATIAATAVYTSPSVASQTAHNLQSWYSGTDGQFITGGGPGASGGIGLNTATFPTLNLDYVNQETELAFTLTKATAGDTGALQALAARIF